MRIESSTSEISKKTGKQRRQWGLRFVLPALAVLFVVGAQSASAQANVASDLTTDSPPFVASGAHSNHSSERGFPLSTIVGDPVGSDGRAPTQDDQIANGLTVNPPTPGQFQGVTHYGFASVGHLGSQDLAPENDDDSIVLQAVEINAPMASQQVSFLFGSTIPVPSTDELEIPLSDPESYWFAEPHDSSNSSNRYYFSRHAFQVFATDAGLIEVVWKKRIPDTTRPADYNDHPERYDLDGGNYFRLYPQQYLVGGNPVKSPQKIFWTEGGYSGPPVIISTAKVPEIHIVYNADVPESVPSEEAEANHRDTPSLIDEGTVYIELAGGQKQIKAFNREGRVFMELLGQTVMGSRRKHLGFEIVDIYKEPIPEDISIDLGDRITAYDDGRDDLALNPEPVFQGGLIEFLRQDISHGVESYYAVRETFSLNDALVFWMRPGEQEIEWPFLYTRYQLTWPTDEDRYSHYVRRPVTTQAAAEETGVPIPTDHAAQLVYEDHLPGAFGGYISGDFKFYTYLSDTYPVHRSLLQYSLQGGIGFERVLSRMVSSSEVVPDVFNGLPPAGGFAKYDDFDPVNKGQQALEEIRFLHQDVEVGQRIEPPVGEFGALASEDYLAGYINTNEGIAYNVNAYVDPFEVGFEEANQGAIIPVNAIPGSESLEVWWFRPSNLGVAQGFKTVYWPSVVGRYTIRWPSSSREIVLASNDGSGSLNSLEAVGTIYVQNEPSAHGYNPNEEHALMSGGQAFALRDDLNVTSGVGYSSEPYVLVDHLDADGRPDTAIFKVLREKAVDDIVFDYTFEAPIVLQAPMPLPLMDLVVRGDGVTQVNNLAEEVGLNLGDDHLDTITSPVWSDDVNREEFGFGLNSLGLDSLVPNTYYLLVNPSDPLEQHWFYLTHTDPTQALGFLSKSRPYLLDDFNQGDQSVVIAGDRVLDVVAGDDVALLLPSSSVHLTGVPISNPDPATRQIQFTGSIATQNWSELVTLATDIESGTLDGWRLYSPSEFGLDPTDAAVNPFVFEDRKGTLWMCRGPHNDDDAVGFAMRFYYKTREGFYFPSASSQPSVGTVVPYLRRDDGIGGWVGKTTDRDNQSLPIVYRPVWPSNPAEMRRGYTLADPAFGLPAVRGQSSMNVLYQQSEHQGVSDNPSVILHDPTREKQYLLGEGGLSKIPDSIRKESYRGFTYFPSLPPHLSERFFFDPNRGSDGALVLRGEFFDEPLDENYLLLNILTPTEIGVLKDLAPSGTQDKVQWDTAISGLSTTLETFVESLTVPGTFVVDLAEDELISVDKISEILSSETAVDSYALSAAGPGEGFVTLVAGNGAAFSPPDEPVSLHVFLVTDTLHRGEVKIVESSNPLAEKLTLQQTVDLAGKADDYVFEWLIAEPAPDTAPPVPTHGNFGSWNPVTDADGTRLTIGGKPDLRSLIDNYLVVRYRPEDADANLETSWSEFTPPQLAEGWIKRVLAGINPFNQRATDLFNNTVNTSASILQQAGSRWEGDVALNLENINDFGLIEIYETILRRGRGLSIDAGYNYGPANDALLLAAGYVNDLYMMVGNEALADAANPTIGIAGTDIATALFSFKGQLATLLDEELALLRGRDDFVQPGVETAPVYNRLIWNFTRGIDSGEVIYANNYNIQESQEDDLDGVIDADDARKMYPQGHGDAYGHFLTALKGYYSLLIHDDFTWNPRTEAVTVLGKPVQVDYFDERKFAAAAGALATAGNQVFDLTWRKDYQSGDAIGWEHLSPKRDNEGTETTRYWGADHWASRTGQGAFLNWVVGNAILPEIDNDPSHEGIQKIDRTTVPELREMTAVLRELQTSMDNAEGGLNPLGLSEDSIPFDISPSGGAPFATGSTSHFEQIYDRAISALNNAVTAFDDAKDVTRKMRTDENSLNGLQASLDSQELAFENELIELYGTPYSDDIGPGRTYATGYDGPDLTHFMYVEELELSNQSFDSSKQMTFRIDTQTHSPEWFLDHSKDEFTPIVQGHINDVEYNEGEEYINFVLDEHGFFEKPNSWTGRRASPGKIQQAISGVIRSQNDLVKTLASVETETYRLHRMIEVFQEHVETIEETRSIEKGHVATRAFLDNLRFAEEVAKLFIDNANQKADAVAAAAVAAVPGNWILGTSNGGDTYFALRGKLVGVREGLDVAVGKVQLLRTVLFRGFEVGVKTAERSDTFFRIDPTKNRQVDREKVLELDMQLKEMQMGILEINGALQSLDDATRNYQALIAKGIRIQQEREIARKRSAAIVQGFRVRDAAFRVFRDEKLERYKTLFDLAARYAFMAAQAFDYETGLLDTSEGRRFIEKIIQSRALGVVAGGEPQFAGSDNGDPGISSALAEMSSEWAVLKGRLGFNNPDVYGTTFSLRTENYRIHPTSIGDIGWREILENSRVPDLLQDPEVRRYCMQISRGEGLPVPGIVLEFDTTIEPGVNFFGEVLGAGDHYFAQDSFAHKIGTVGVALEGYIGMSSPSSTASVTGGSSTAAPSWSFLDPLALAATPHVYLVPVGLDAMRSPALGDSSEVRMWKVDDVIVPLPFNIGGSEFSAQPLHRSGDSLTEPLFGIRKHRSFRPVDDASVYEGSNGRIFPSTYTNSRLIGRSVWNTKWKLVIPGHYLLSDPNEGLDRLIETLKDVKLHFETYSYSGN